MQLFWFYYKNTGKEESAHCEALRTVFFFRGEAETLEGTKSVVIKCRAVEDREWALNWGIPVWNDDVFPPSAVSDKLISRADSEVLQPPSAGSRLLPSYTTSTH